MSTWEIERDRTNVVCPDCAFSFDAIHQDGDGGYTCPLCEPAPASGEPSGAEAVVREAWRPIETAPKDGKNVLIASGSGEVGEARFHGEDGWWWINNDPTDAWGSEVYPTHWMPLPAQPDADTRPDTFDEAAEQARLGYVPVNGAPLPAAPGAPEEGAGE